MDNVSAITDQSSTPLKINTQAMMEFGRIWAGGCRNISEIMGAASQAHFDHVTTTLRAMSDVRTIKGAMELQMSATCTSMEQVLANTSKLSTACMRLADQAMVPIKARIEATMAKSTSTKSELA